MCLHYLDILELPIETIVYRDKTISHVPAACPHSVVEPVVPNVVVPAAPKPSRKMLSTLSSASTQLYLFVLDKN